MPSATCEHCGWTRPYATENGRRRGLRRHLRRRCRPYRAGGNRPTPAQKDAKARRAVKREGRRWRALAGRRGEQSAARWVAHPYALDDLLRVLGYTATVRDIARERIRALRARRSR